MCQGFAIQNKISGSRKMETWGHTCLWNGILRCLDPVNGGKLSFCGTVTFCLLSYTNEEDSLAAPPLNKKRSHVSAESEWEQSAICSFMWCSHMLVLSPSLWTCVQQDKLQCLSTPFSCSVWYCIINKPFSLFVYALTCLSKQKQKDTDVCQVTKKWKMCYWKGSVTD